MPGASSARRRDRSRRNRRTARRPRHGVAPARSHHRARTQTSRGSIGGRRAERGRRCSSAAASLRARDRDRLATATITTTSTSPIPPSAATATPVRSGADAGPGAAGKHGAKSLRDSATFTVTSTSRLARPAESTAAIAIVVSPSGRSRPSSNIRSLSAAASSQTKSPRFSIRIRTVGMFGGSVARRSSSAICACARCETYKAAWTPRGAAGRSVGRAATRGGLPACHDSTATTHRPGVPSFLG